MATRLITAGLLGLIWGRVNPLWPLLLYYNQIVGATLKSSINFRFNQQKWTRQGISSLEAADPRQARSIRRESAALHLASLLALAAAVSFAPGALGIPDRHTWQSLSSTQDARSAAFLLAAALLTKTALTRALAAPDTTTPG